MKLFSGRLEKVGYIIGGALMVILIAVLIVTTQVALVYETLALVLGGSQREAVSGNPEDYVYYTSDYETKDDAVEAADQLTELIVEEGAILLKNDNDALPMSNEEGAMKVSVFGKNSTDIVLGGSGSAAHESDNASSVYESLESAGFEYNPTLKSFYDNDSLSGTGREESPAMGTIPAGIAIGETPIANFTDEIRSSYSDYSDAAIIVLSRLGGEGWDIPRTMATGYDADGNPTGTIDGAKSNEDHYLELDQNETDMIAEVTSAGFDRVIVVINCSQTMELGFIEENDKIDAALWVGSPGEKGINALGRLLDGEVNPSGKTVDTYSADFKLDPTWNNFSNNNTASGNLMNYMDITIQNAVVDYEEGIYVGYRYYETRGYSDGKDWYGENVVYPLGYGMSYTDFSYEVVDTTTTAEGTIDSDDTITVSVEVTNKGDIAGKETVQLYYSSPYTNTEIEKAHVVMGGFAKTDILEAGESEIVTMTITAQDMASYDYNDANDNSFSGYELEAGDYNLYVSANAHSWADANDDLTLTYTVASDIKYTTDAATGNTVENRFDDADDGLDVVLSRADWDGTWPTVSTYEDRTIDADMYATLYACAKGYTADDDESDPWYVSEMPTYAETAASYDDTEYKLDQLIGEDYDSELWDKLMDQLTLTEMSQLIGQGCYSNKEILRINKLACIDTDGPIGFTMFMQLGTDTDTIYNTGYYTSGCVLAATYNVELAEAMGVSIGNEAVLGNERGDGTPYSGWYAPAANIHRSAFGGRNWEYMSEDGFLSGKISAAIIDGATSKGVYTFMKHFAVNDQETNRDSNGLVTWITEQAMREIYLKPFEIAVKEADSPAIMSSFNRIGTTWAGGSYELLTEVLREEWGFNGAVITDFNTPTYTYMDPDQMIRAGGNLNLAQDTCPSIDAASITPTQVSCIRESAKAVLYVVANSCAMNGIGAGVEYQYVSPWWVRIEVALVIVFAVGMAGWTGFIAYRVIKKKKKKSE